MNNSEILFVPTPDELTVEPYIDPFIISFDDQDDPFKSNIHLDHEGIRISGTGSRRFGLSVRWKVEGYGYLFMPLDNGGEFYSVETGEKKFDLSFELLKTRVYRNLKRLTEFTAEGFSPSRELNTLLYLGEEYFSDARKRSTALSKEKFSFSDRLKTCFVRGRKFRNRKIGFPLEEKRYEREFPVWLRYKRLFPNGPESVFGEVYRNI